MNKIFLDARLLEHPQPLEISISHLKQMNKDDYFYMINNKNPLPLIQLSQEKGFVSLSFEDEKGIWHIIITKNREYDLKKLLNV